MAEEKEKQKKEKPAKAQQQGGGKGEKRGRKPSGPEQQIVLADEKSHEPVPPARLAVAYREQIAPALMQQFAYKNKMQVPKLQKIVISMGVGRYGTAGGEGKSNIEKAEKELTVIAGQKPVRCKAKKSVANFKLREGMDIGLKVTLRGGRMYEFLDRVVSLAIPRVKDFRGLNPNGFDKAGNYNFGFTEQTVFPEVDGAAVTFQQGMNITVVTTAESANEGRELLKAFGFPFRTEEKQS
jgi:large subunit ribosomal protein L5